MTNEDLIKIGFEKMPHYTVVNAVMLKIGRGRHISAGCVGTPNESVWLCYMEDEESGNIDDLVCIHNYDYDGYLTETKIKTIIMAITGKTEFAPAEPTQL